MLPIETLIKFIILFDKKETNVYESLTDDVSSPFITIQRAKLPTTMMDLIVFFSSGIFQIWFLEALT